MNPPNAIRTYVSHIQSVLGSDLDEALKGHAFAISWRPISHLMEELSGHEALTTQWNALEREWVKIQTSDEKVARLRCVLDAIKGTKVGQDLLTCEPMPSLFQKNGIALRSLCSRLKQLQSVFEYKERKETTKMTLFKGLDETISCLIRGLDGQHEVTCEWNAIRTARNEAKTHTAFIQQCCALLPPLIERVECEIERLDRLHTVVDTQEKAHQDHSWLRRDELRTLLIGSLPKETEKQRLAWPHTFQAIDTLVLRILQGDYGASIREHLLTQGFFAQEHFLVLLLADLVRCDMHSIQDVEIFYRVPQGTLELVTCTKLDNDTIFSWISSDGATLPECFIEAAASARLEDEKQFSCLREYARLHYAPSPEALLYLVLNANEPTLLQDIDALVEKSISSLLCQAYSLVCYPDPETASDELDHLLETIDDENAKQEWFDSIIKGIALDHGLLAISIAQDFLDGSAFEEMRASLVVTYAERHYEAAKALFTILPAEYQQTTFLSIIACCAQHNPQRAISLLNEETLNPGCTLEALSSIAKSQRASLKNGLFMDLLERVPDMWKVAFCAAMAVHLIETNGLSLAYARMLAYVPDEPRELIIFIAYYHHSEDLRFPDALPFLIDELGWEHADLIRTGMMLNVRFTTTNQPEAFEEELAILDSITDPSLLERALISYLHHPLTWEPHEFDQSRAEEQRRRIECLEPLLERVCKEASFDRLQYLLSRLATDCDKKRMIALLCNIKDPILRSKALMQALMKLEFLVVRAVRTEFHAIPAVPDDIYTLPDYLETLDHLIGAYAQGNPSLLTDMRTHLTHIWAPFSSKQAIRLLESLPTKDAKELVTLVRSITVGHFSRHNSDQGKLISLLNVLPKEGSLYFEREYMSTLRLLLTHRYDANGAMELTPLIEGPETRIAALSSIMSHLCTESQFTPNWVIRVTEALDPKLREGVLEQLFSALRKYMHSALQGDEKRAPIIDMQPLSESLPALCSLVERWAGGGGSWCRRLAWLYAPFASAQALALLKSADSEPPEMIRATLQHIAIHAFSGYNKERGAIDSILEWLFRDLLSNAETIALVAFRLISDEGRIQTALVTLNRLLHDCHIKIAGPLEERLDACIQGLRKYDPECSLQLLQGSQTPPFLTWCIIHEIIPNLLHSGTLHRSHISIICNFARRCSPKDADDIYGELACACVRASFPIERIRLLVSMIKDKQIQSRWSATIDTILKYKSLYRKGTFPSESKLSEFAVTIAPFLFKEALNIAIQLIDPRLTSHILHEVMNAASITETEWVLFLYYSSEIHTILNRLRIHLPHLVEQLPINIPPHS